MLDLLRDPLWQFVGAVLTLVAIAAPIVVFLWERQRKGVSYAIVSRIDLLKVHEKFEGKLQVRYLGEPIKSLSALFFKVWNSGNQPILASDFERPISITVENGSRLLYGAVAKVDPDGLVVEVNVDENTASIKPTLLNPGDAIEFYVIVRDINFVPCHVARIIGVKAIREVKNPTRVSPNLRITLFFLQIINLFMILFSTWLFIDTILGVCIKTPPPFVTWLVAIFMVGFWIFWFYLTERIIRLVRLVRQSLFSR